MAILKCKMCGGTVQAVGARIGECDSCGTRVLLPPVDEERIYNLYNRGNHFREVGEYDRAYSAYESITAENRDDPEAHWCLMLCRYGINYVREENGGFKPTISRMNRASILEDPDYRAALRCSEKEIADQYRREGSRLADLQNRFLEIMKKEPPTDVFICFKAQEPDGSHTRASEMGMDIYEELTARGLRVFFSRITLENKLGEEYEPYIFSALYSARVMLVVADKPEQLNARWVRNEWIRFLAMMDQDHTKAMIPVFRGMSPYDFPPEISMVQGQDMEKLGAMQDLTGNVLKLCGKGPENVKLVRTAPETGFNVENILRRVKISMEEKDFVKAGERLEEILEKAPETGEAWFLKLLVEYEAQSWQSLDLNNCVWMDSWEWKNARKYENEELKNQLDAIEKNCQQRKILEKAQKHMNSREYEQAIELFATLGKFGKANKKLAECKKILSQRKNLIEYKSEIGDPKSYIRRRVEAEHPKEYEKMENLNRKVDGKKAPLLDFGWGNLIIAAILGGLFYMGIRNEGINAAGGTFAVVAAIVVAVLIGIVLGSFKIAVILAIIFVVILDRIPENIAIIGGCIGCAAVELISILSGIVSIRRKGAIKASECYYSEKIAPLEERIRAEIKEKWTSRVGEENLYSLEGFQQD